MDFIEAGKRKRAIFRPPFRIGIRAQLTALVSIVACLSLIILAVTTGVYFTSNYKNLRSDRLYIAAQLKSSQLDQTLSYLYYQCYWVASRDTLQNALANYVAGNKTEENWADSISVIQKFLSSSNLFYLSRVYDYDFKTVLNTTNNGTGDLVPKYVQDQLFPLSSNLPLPSSLMTNGILTDPVLNGTDYLMSMSLPIFANPSIIFSELRVYGYITVVMSAEGLRSVFNDTTALEKSNVAIVSARYSNYSRLDSYHFVFPPYGVSPTILNQTFPLRNSSFLNGAFKQAKGGSLKKTKFFYTKDVAIGYYPCSFNFVNWVAVVSQAESVFLSPSTKLTKIISGTVVGIAVFMSLLTLPLAHWAVKPIVRLQKATELIAEGRGLRTANNGSSSRAGSRTSSLKKDISELNFVNRLPLGEKNRNIDDSASDSNYATDGSLSHDMQSQTSRRHSDTDRSSSRSRYLTTSTNLTEARLPDYRILFSDELSDLTNTFNAMTDALDQHYALLEDRVRARTKQLEAAKIEAEAANEAKTVFIANISHELRTPLNGILGMTAISMEETDISKIRNSLKLIFRSGELLLHILTELLTFSKNVLKRTSLEKRNFCITDVALQIKSIFGKVAKDQHVRLSIILSPNIMRTMVLWGDSNRIIQIVMNLVSNALKFTPIDGKVDVRIKLLGEYDEEATKAADYKEIHIKEGPPLLSPSNEDVSKIPFSSSETNSTASSKLNEKVLDDEDDEDDNEPEEHIDDLSSVVSSSTSSYDNALFNTQFKKTPGLYEENNDALGTELKEQKTWVFAIEVQDTGPGIDPKLHESVFEPFVQGDQTLSRQYGGTGLGLSICRQLATMMHGTMKLESEVDVGSKFTFTVPLTQTRVINFDDVEEPFDDEFNPQSKKNRRVKFKDTTRSLRSRKSRTSVERLNSNSTEKKLPECSTPSLKIEEIKSEEEEPQENDDKKKEKDNSSPEIAVKSESQKEDKVHLDRPFLQSTGTATSSRNVPTMAAVVDKHFKILVAEDNHVNQEVIKRMLNLEGIDNIDLACDGQDAFDKVKSLVEKNDAYDLIFMDVQMPKVDGLLSTKMIRNDLKYTGSIVALTAFADDSNIKECLEAGMNGFLSKPIKRPKLKMILEEYCPNWKELKKEQKKVESK
ncbi:Osmosensing histidine protein kinase SLN1 [Nakaseomyces bracarensis]|uniref:histidine kinase n=1 Tax=Nakaseomyces bracarensis TaxID=273131 RepID=A0ABR4NN41_9SACH